MTTIRSMRRAAGFTLIELVVVLAILAICATFVVANIELMIPSTRLEACARILSSDITLARSSAIAQGLPYRIEYDIDTSQYRVASPFKSDNSGGIATTDEERAYTNWKEFPSDVKIQSIICGLKHDSKDWAWQEITRGIYRIDIRPNGNTIEHIIHLKREGTELNFYLSVQGLTGFVQLYGGDWRPDVVTDGDF
ncbi:MAG: prepilin-type N-terminal cleavage/methylation domain-containing protein [Planctomycetes bacterium]|nr:prepilin-type N-terminal cleavage/methylation domain-containing protein [Planctomycetota bacterium]